MAKINRVSRLNDLWLVRIDVDDPECKWNINPTSTYYKLIKATSINAAIRKAANYCNSQMSHFEGTFFKYTTQDVKPYIYNYGTPSTEEKEQSFVKVSKY